MKINKSNEMELVGKVIVNNKGQKANVIEFKNEKYVVEVEGKQKEYAIASLKRNWEIEEEIVENDNKEDILTEEQLKTVLENLGIPNATIDEDTSNEEIPNENIPTEEENKASEDIEEDTLNEEIPNATIDEDTSNEEIPNENIPSEEENKVSEDIEEDTSNEEIPNATIAEDTLNEEIPNENIPAEEGNKVSEDIKEDTLNEEIPNATIAEDTPNEEIPNENIPTEEENKVSEDIEEDTENTSENKSDDNRTRAERAITGELYGIPVKYNKINQTTIWKILNKIYNDRKVEKNANNVIEIVKKLKSEHPTAFAGAYKCLVAKCRMAYIDEVLEGRTYEEPIKKENV